MEKLETSWSSTTCIVFEPYGGFFGFYLWPEDISDLCFLCVPTLEEKTEGLLQTELDKIVTCINTLQKEQKKNITIIGYSLGAYVAAYVTSKLHETPPVRLVLLQPFYDGVSLLHVHRVKSLIERVLKFGWKEFGATIDDEDDLGFKTWDYVGKCQCSIDIVCASDDETVGDQRQKWNGLLQKLRLENQNTTRLFRLYVLDGSHATFMYRRYRYITNRESELRVRIVGLPTDLNSKTGTISRRSLNDSNKFDVNLDDNSTGHTISIDPVNLNFLLW